jgi:hypothetical protein
VIFPHKRKLSFSATGRGKALALAEYLSLLEDAVLRAERSIRDNRGNEVLVSLNDTVEKINEYRAMEYWRTWRRGVGSALMPILPLKP